MELSIQEFCEITGITPIETLRLLDRGSLKLKIKDGKPAIMFEETDLEPTLKEVCRSHIEHYLQSKDDEEQEVLGFIEEVVKEGVSMALKWTRESDE